MRPVRPPLSALAVSCAALACPLPVSAADAPPLVVISIDGLHPSSVLEAESLGLRLPNLRRFVTGVAPARHGILYNSPFDPLGSNLDGWYWYAQDIRVPTLWDVAMEAGIPVANVDWPVTVGAKIRWNIVQFWRTDVPDAPDDRKLSRLLSTPGLLAEAEAVLGPYPSGYAYDVAADRRRAAFNVWLLERKRPRLHFAYFSTKSCTSPGRGVRALAASSSRSTLSSASCARPRNARATAAPWSRSCPITATSAPLASCA